MITVRLKHWSNAAIVAFFHFTPPNFSLAASNSLRCPHSTQFQSNLEHTHAHTYTNSKCICSSGFIVLLYFYEHDGVHFTHWILTRISIFIFIVAPALFRFIFNWLAAQPQWKNFLSQKWQLIYNMITFWRFDTNVSLELFANRWILIFPARF